MKKQVHGSSTRLVVIPAAASSFWNEDCIVLNLCPPSLDYCEEWILFILVRLAAWAKVSDRDEIVAALRRVRCRHELRDALIGLARISEANSTLLDGLFELADQVSDDELVQWLDEEMRRCG